MYSEERVIVPGWGEGSSGELCLMRTKFQFGMIKKVLETDNGEFAPKCEST